MKKVLLTIIMTMMAVSMFAENWPGWNCTDVAKLEKAKQGYLAEKDSFNLLFMDSLLSFAKSAPKSFSDVEKVVNSLKKPDNYSDEVFSETKIHIIKALCCNRQEFMLDAWEFCKKHPTNYDYYYVAFHAKKLNLTDEFVYDFMVKFINENQNNVRVKKALQIALDKSVNVDSVKVKADLQKLNRIFSRKLLQDKAKWEPVVAEIRTVLETY